MVEVNALRAECLVTCDEAKATKAVLAGEKYMLLDIGYTLQRGEVSVGGLARIGWQNGSEYGLVMIIFEAADALPEILRH